MVSSLRNRGTVFQELRYPKTGMAVQSGQDSSVSHFELSSVNLKTPQQLDTVRDL